jgi:hypothetical protein
MTDNRLDILVHYICARCDDPNRLGATRLNKVLWYSDVLAFAATGASITGASYVKRQFGPVPRSILEARARLRQSGAIIERKVPYGNQQQTQVIALSEPDISSFSADQISLVDRVIQAICFNHAATSISWLSHDLVWESARIGEEIPMRAAAFAGAIGEIDETDMEWATGEIARIEGNMAIA